MIILSTRVSLGLLALLVVASTACVTTFNKTGAALGDAMVGLPRALAPETALASRLCEQRARLDFLQHLDANGVRPPCR